MAEQFANISGADQWTDPLSLRALQTATISIAGNAFNGEIVLERRARAEDGTWRAWHPVDTWTGDGTAFDKKPEQDYRAGEDQEIRLGCPTGAHNSGDADCRLGRA